MVCGLVRTFRERLIATNFEYELVDSKMTAHFSASYNIDIFVAHRRRESIQIICRAEGTQ